MDIYFVRHTSVDVPKGVCYGSTDVAVRSSFPDEASVVKSGLHGISFDAVFTSPLTRARQLARFCGYPEAKEDNRLREFDFGEWEMCSYDDLYRENAEFRFWIDNYLNAQVPGGDSLPIQEARVRDFIDEILRSGYQRVCAFCHGGVLALARAISGEMSVAESFGCVPPYGSILKLSFNSDDRLPQEFKSQMREMLGEEADDLFKSLNSEASVSVRVNKEKEKDIKACKDNAEYDEVVGWCPCGFYLSKRPEFTFDPLFHAGMYYVQEASSMFLYQFVKRYLSDNPIIALDMCAAPGGKSTLLLSSLPSGSLLFSNEIDRRRSQILTENIIKWGHPNVVVTNDSSESYSKSGLKFDFILCDAPCSGEGMMRKNAVASEEWSLENVIVSSERQRDILSNCWECLKPGGILVYSTCTFNTSEDECNARFIQEELGGTPLSVDVDAAWGIDTKNYLGSTTPVYHFFPHKTRGEGFFICCFQKQGVYEEKRSKRHTDKNRQTTGDLKEISTWLKNSDKYRFSKTADGDIYAVLKDHEEMSAFASRKLKVIYQGIKVAEAKGKKIRPSHALAMSLSICPSVFPLVEIDKDTALSYLMGESIILSPETPRGYVLLLYKGMRLGFANNLGSRANNLYPEHWRIRKSISSQ